jgi:hypothetical protein
VPFVVLRSLLRRTQLRQVADQLTFRPSAPGLLCQ